MSTILTSRSARETRRSRVAFVASVSELEGRVLLSAGHHPHVGVRHAAVSHRAQVATPAANQGTTSNSNQAGSSAHFMAPARGMLAATRAAAAERAGTTAPWPSP